MKAETTRTGNSADVSVVIPSYNSRDTIIDCLRSILEQEGHPPREVIVVDSSTDGTGELISQTFPEVELVQLEQQTHAGICRNIGARRASGKIVAFTDADCVTSPNWISSIVEAQNAEGRRARVVAGAIDNGTPNSAVGTAEWFIQFSNAFPGLPPHTVPFAATANLSMPRDLFLDSEGFDDSKTGQDMVFGEMLRRRGRRIEFDARTEVAHRNRSELREFLSRQYILGRGSALIRRRIPLKGHCMVRLPFLVPLLIPYRMYRIVRRVLMTRRSYFPALLRSLPCITAGLGAWSLGFLTGSFGRVPEQSSLDDDS